MTINTSDISQVIRKSKYTVCSVNLSEWPPVKQATCIKQACVHFLQKANTLKCCGIKQASVSSKLILIMT